MGSTEQTAVGSGGADGVMQQGVYYDPSSSAGAGGEGAMQGVYYQDPAGSMGGAQTDAHQGMATGYGGGEMPAGGGGGSQEAECTPECEVQKTADEIAYEEEW